MHEMRETEKWVHQIHLNHARVSSSSPFCPALILPAWSLMCSPFTWWSGKDCLNDTTWTLASSPEVTCFLSMKSCPWSWRLFLIIVSSSSSLFMGAEGNPLTESMSLSLWFAAEVHLTRGEISFDIRFLLLGNKKEQDSICPKRISMKKVMVAKYMYDNLYK